uniref:Uncharacterized protein n=1 Tax=Plectus sambesii TaxID=2011161 RepID=A0A914VIP9_9BILA
MIRSAEPKRSALCCLKPDYPITGQSLCAASLVALSPPADLIVESAAAIPFSFGVLRDLVGFIAGAAARRRSPEEDRVVGSA